VSPVGGAIWHSGAPLHIVDSHIVDNAAGAWGGGLYVDRALAVIARSTFSANTLPGTEITEESGFGGAIFQAGGNLTIQNSTFSHNGGVAGPVAGSALHTGFAGGQTRIIASTFVDNTGEVAVTRAARTICRPPSACQFQQGASIFLVGNVITGPGDDCSGAITSGGHNLVSDSSCATSSPSDIDNAAAMLEPLADNGGPTPTHRPGPLSPALNSIPAGTPGFCDGTVGLDQRHVFRPRGGACDRGAVEQ
jgi:hypothetical protein